MIRRAPTSILVLAGVIGSACPSMASITCVTARSYRMVAEDYDGTCASVYVIEMYACTDDLNDVVLNVYNFSWGQGPCYQSFTSTGWIPTNLGGSFDTPALRKADSFVTIGGFGYDRDQAPGVAPGTGLDPNFGGNNVPSPEPQAGWYNGSPLNLNGQVTTYNNDFNGVLLARFASLEPLQFGGVSVELTWNQGPGTQGNQQGFIAFTYYNDCSQSDLDHDLIVGSGDLGLLLGEFGNSCSIADIDGDGVVGAEDLGMLLGDWGEKCEFWRLHTGFGSRGTVRLLPGGGGDLDSDGRIGEADLQRWMREGPAGEEACDINGDGAIDGADLGVLLANWTPPAE